MVNYSKLIKKAAKDAFKEPNMLVASGHLATEVPAEVGQAPFSLSTFTNTLPHEFAHAAVAEALGADVEGIYLYPRGGHVKMDAQTLSDSEKALVYAAGPWMNIGINALTLWASRKTNNSSVRKLLEGHAVYSTLKQVCYPLEVLKERLVDGISRGDFYGMETYLERATGTTIPAGTMELLFLGLYTAPIAAHMYLKHKESQENKEKVMEEVPYVEESFSFFEPEAEMFLEEVSQNATNVADVVLLQDGVYDIRDTIDAGSYGRVIPQEKFDPKSSGLGAEAVERFTVEKDGEKFIYLEGLLQESYVEIIESRDEKWFDENAVDIHKRWGVDLIRTSSFFRRRKFPAPYKDTAIFLSMYSEGMEIEEIAGSMHEYRLPGPVSGVRGI